MSHVLNQWTDCTVWTSSGAWQRWMSWQDCSIWQKARRPYRIAISNVMTFSLSCTCRFPCHFDLTYWRSDTWQPISNHAVFSVVYNHPTNGRTYHMFHTWVLALLLKLLRCEVGPSTFRSKRTIVISTPHVERVRSGSKSKGLGCHVGIWWAGMRNKMFITRQYHQCNNFVFKNCHNLIIFVVLWHCWLTTRLRYNWNSLWLSRLELDCNILHNFKSDSDKCTDGAATASLDSWVAIRSSKFQKIFWPLCWWNKV